MGSAPHRVIVMMIMLFLLVIASYIHISKHCFGGIGTPFQIFFITQNWCNILFSSSYLLLATPRHVQGMLLGTVYIYSTSSLKLPVPCSS